MGIFGFSLLFFGIVFIICYPIARKKNTRCSAQTRGVLVEIAETDSSSGNVGHVNVYSYYVEGIEYQLRSPAYNKQVGQVGDSCTIWYNPKKPKEAQEFHFSNRYLKIILLSGIAMIVLGVILSALSL